MPNLFATAILTLLMPSLSFFYVLKGLFGNKKFAIYYGTLFALIIGIILYHIVPSETFDLYRYYDYLDQLKYDGIGPGWQEIWTNSDPLSYSFMFLISLCLGNHFVPLVTALVGYGIIFYIIFDYSRIECLSNKATNIVLLYFLTSYNIVNILTGVRFGLGVTLFLLALYIDVIKKHKALSIILYALSPLFHSTMATLLLLRLAVGIIKDRLAPLQYLIVALIGVSSSIILSTSAILSNIPFLQVLASKAETYLQVSLPGGLWYYFNVFVSILILIALLIFHHRHKEHRIILRINIFVFIIALVNVMNSYVAGRYMAIGRFIFIISLITIISNVKTKEVISKDRMLAYLLIGGYSIIIIGYLIYQFVFLFFIGTGDLLPEGLIKSYPILLQL